MSRSRPLSLWAACLAWFLPAAGGYSAENFIQVDCTKSLGEVPKLVFGSNLLAHDPAFSTSESWAKNYSGYREYGSGVWDPARMQPVRSLMELGQEAGISALRFPGGCGSHGYEWKKAIGKGRNRFKFGLYEFYRVCRELNAEPVITLSYFHDTPQDAADLVAFLNGLPDEAARAGSKNRGRPDWPGVRAEYGHPEPLKVKYFEIGNEVWHGDHLRIKKVEPDDYARRYLQYFNAMKAVDPSVQIGAVLDTDSWNQKVLSIIQGSVDFGILHTYPAPGYGRELEELPAEKLFAMCLGMPVVITEPQYRRTLALLKKDSGRDIPLAITEFNGGFFMRSPIPYQFTLGNALINAELLRIFMKPENHILLANNWNFSNEHWGMLGNGFDNDASQLGNPYRKRPNFLVFELYHRHFGGLLLPVSVKSETYRERGYTVDEITVNASLNSARSKVCLMVLNKNLRRPRRVEISLQGFGAPSGAEAWVLNGPDYLSLNEKKADTVQIRRGEAISILANGNLTAELEPHSLTAIEIKR